MESEHNGSNGVPKKSFESSESKNEHRKTMIKNLKGKITIPKFTPSVDNDPYLEEYEEIDKVGEGNHAFVMKVLHKATNTIYAAKIYTKLEDESILTVQNEYLALKQLDHPNIVHSHEIFIHEQKKVVRIIMEYVDSEKLAKKIANRSLKEKDLAYIFLQLFDCLNYMHLKGICHRDLNPTNVMVDKNLQIKIIDFSASKLFKQLNEINPMITPIGTPAYKAPEIFTAASYGEKVDMWAAGIILFEAVFFRKPFNKETLDELIKAIEMGKLKFSVEEISSRNWSTLSIDLIYKLLTLEPEKRINAVEAMKHPWIRSFFPEDDF